MAPHQISREMVVIREREGMGTNQGVPGFEPSIRWITITLTFIKGP
jgi:hypothetical protein